MDDLGRLKEEKAYLEKVKNKIIEEKKEQNKSLERIPWEYKGRYAEVKWGDEDLVDSLTKMCMSRIKILDNLEDKPYFGRFDFKPDDMDELSKLYIGKADLSDGNGNLVLDWRSPICTLYYDQSLGRVSYMAPLGEISGNLNRKSQILISKGIFENYRDVDLVSDDELLQPYLNVNADNRMKTIIASIQHEQNSIIRKKITDDLIIQGVAGSGKTSVALHRIAYLIYNMSNQYSSDNFVIIGPNKYFLNYISSILPELDTTAVKEITFEEIAGRLLNNDKYVIANSTDEFDSFLQSNQNSLEIKKIKGKLSYKKAIDQFLNDYFLTNLAKGITVDEYEIVSLDYIKKNIYPSIGYINSILSFSKLINKKVKHDYDEMYSKYSAKLFDELRKLDFENSNRIKVIEKIDKLKLALTTGFSAELKKYIKPFLIDKISLYKLFIENIDKYLDLPDETLINLKNSTLKNIAAKKISSDDLAALSYLSIMQEGNYEYDKYIQIVIDESQDFNEFQFSVLKSMFKKGHFSIFGDLAQAIYPYKTITSWEAINEEIFDNKCEIVPMKKSYRNTKEITNFSNNVLRYINMELAEPVIREGKDISILKIDAEDKIEYYLNKKNELINKNYKSIGIICKTESEMTEVDEILKKAGIEFNYIRGTDKDYKAGISLLTSSLAKGLEFDAVILNDASANIYKENSQVDMHLLYVAMTRSMHELEILCSNELTEPLNNEDTKKIIKEYRKIKKNK